MRHTTQSIRTARAGVIGATGNTGVELVCILDGHPGMEVAFGTSRELAGHCLTEVDPAAPALELTDPDDVDPSMVDVIFLCLPHGSSAPVARAMLDRGGRAVIDLSGDLRLTDGALHERIYGSRRDQALAEEAVYGLPELSRSEIGAARLVANPGCYATAAVLALLPLAESGCLPAAYVDAKSGVSGAGRAATPTTHFCSAHDDVMPYKVGRAHRHVPEMEQTLRGAGAGPACTLTFVPHLVPLERGILATTAVRGAGLDGPAARKLYAERYAREPLVGLLNEGGHARLRAVAHSDRAVLSLHAVPDQDLLIIASAIDNLGKGAAGQAVQNANLMLGRPETEGLRTFSSRSG